MSESHRRRGLEGTGFLEPPRHLRRFYEIVDKDYGNTNQYYTYPLPNRRGEYLFTCAYWFNKLMLDRKPHLDLTFQHPKWKQSDVGFATSGTETYIYKRFAKYGGSGELWMSFTAAILGVSPAVYDMWYDEKRDATFLLMEFVTPGSLDTLEGLDRERFWKDYDAYMDFVDFTLTKYSLYHPEPFIKNSVWRKADERYLIIDWGGPSYPVDRLGEAKPPHALTLRGEVEFLTSGTYPWWDQKLVSIPENEAEEVLITDMTEEKHLPKEEYWKMKQPRVPPSRRKLTMSRKKRLKGLRQKYAVVAYSDTENEEDEQKRQHYATGPDDE